MGQITGVEFFVIVVIAALFLTPFYLRASRLRRIRIQEVQIRELEAENERLRKKQKSQSPGS